MELLREYAATFNVFLTEMHLAQFARYQRLLLDWNQRMSLTAITDPEDIQVRHFLDSLTCTTVTGDLNGRSLVDVGSGPGFPGLPLKLLYPDLRLTLVESTGKKTRFLHAVVDALDLQAVTILQQRAEAVGQRNEHRGCYDWAVARAVADLRILAEYLLPLCRVGGCMLAQKGEDVTGEVETARQAIATLGGGSVEIHPVQLPGWEIPYHLVVIEKTAVTPAKYPRRIGIPAKRPL